VPVGDDTPATRSMQSVRYKTHYNTYEGSATTEAYLAFVNSDERVKIPESAWKATPYSGDGKIVGTNGAENPQNFLATDADVQMKARELSGAFGRPLMVTPHGGKNARPDRPDSMHPVGKALDFYIEGMTDEEKSRLVATAVKLGYRGLGTYGPNSDGYGTIHLDLRPTNGKQWDKLAIWHYGGGVQPKWFIEGLAEGRRLRDNAA
jgi:hypothetical protein